MTMSQGRNGAYVRKCGCCTDYDVAPRELVIKSKSCYYIDVWVMYEGEAPLQCVLLRRPRWASCFNSTSIGTASCIPQEQQSFKSLRRIEAVRCVLALCSPAAASAAHVFSAASSPIESATRCSQSLGAAGPSGPKQRREQRQRPCSRAEHVETSSSIDVIRASCRSTEKARQNGSVEDAAC